jgi:hypothetical protein
VTFSGKVNNADNTVGATAQELSINAGSGAVLFSETLGDVGALGAISINSTGATTFTKAVDAASLTTNAGGTVIIKGGRITTLGSQSYGEDVVVTGMTTLDASALTFADTLMGDNLASHDVTLVARTGNATFNAAVGDAAAPMDHLLVTAANDTVFNDLVTVAHLQTGTTGRTLFNTAKVVTTSPSSMVFGNDVVVSPANFTFDSTDDGLLSTGANITFHKTLSSSTAGVSDVAIQAGSTGVVRFLGAVGKDGNGTNSALKSLVVSAGGGIVIGGGHVHTTGTQTYGNPIELTSSVVFIAEALSWGRVTSTMPDVGLTLSTNGHQILTDISITGDLDVTTGMAGQMGGVSQASGTSLNIGGSSMFTAHTTQGQTAVLDNTGNNFAKDLSFLTSNGGSWTRVDVKSESALTMGSTTVDGPIQLQTTTGDISQTGPMNVTGTANFKTLAGSILLNNPSNVFDGRVSVDTPRSIKIFATGPLAMDKVAVGLDAELQSTGLLNLGTGTYGKKLKANSGGFEIIQSGRINFGGDTDFDAGSAKIELFNPYNQWRGGIVFKGGIIMINHPVLMNAVNAGTLNMRAQMSSSSSAKPNSGGASGDGMRALQALPAKAIDGPAVLVSVDKPSPTNANGLITVALSSETASPGRSFSFELDPKIVTNQPTDAGIKVSQLDGKPMPDWLRYEPTTKTFIAKEVPAGAFPLQLKVGIGGQETLMVIQAQDAIR